MNLGLAQPKSGEQELTKPYVDLEKFGVQFLIFLLLKGQGSPVSLHWQVWKMKSTGTEERAVGGRQRFRKPFCSYASILPASLCPCTCADPSTPNPRPSQPPSIFWFSPSQETSCAQKHIPRIFKPSLHFKRKLSCIP